jgi:hypothetical protein
MSGRAFLKYKRYYRWWATTEKTILRLAILLFAVLYTTQLLNFVLEQHNSRLLTSSIGKLEGVAMADSQTMLNTGVMELTVVSNAPYDKLQIYINGVYYKDFDKKTVSLSVKNNDIIEISGIKNEFPASIKITSVSGNMSAPKLGSHITVNKNFVQAARIRIK